MYYEHKVSIYQMFLDYLNQQALEENESKVFEVPILLFSDDALQ